MKTVAIGVALLICSYAHSQGIKDTIYFTNGTLVIGKIKNIKLGVIIFDPDDANDITVQTRKLKTIAGGRRIFRVETTDNQIYFVRISPHPTISNQIYGITGTDTFSINTESISVLYPFENSLSQRFSGTMGLGYTYTKSSGFGRLNFDTKLKYVSRKEELSLNLSGIYTIYDSLFSRDKEEVNLKYNYYFTQNWFATVFLVYQRNLELGLARRYQEGLGIGNKFITTRHVYAWARVGSVLNQEKSTDGVSSGVLSELFGQFEFNFFKFEKPKINFIFGQAFYYSLSESGRIRNDGSMSVTWEIFKNFNFSLEPYNSFDSRPPGGEGREFDFGVVFGINYKFNQ